MQLILPAEKKASSSRLISGKVLPLFA